MVERGGGLGPGVAILMNSMRVGREVKVRGSASRDGRLYIASRDAFEGKGRMCEWGKVWCPQIRNRVTGYRSESNLEVKTSWRLLNRESGCFYFIF